jgi:uncharacterized protein (DUF885 family)
MSALRRRTLVALDKLSPSTSDEWVTTAAAREQLTVMEQLRAAGVDESCLNNTEGPVQTVRLVFDSMPTGTVDDWATMAIRLAAVPQALAGYADSLRYAAARGQVSARR